MSNPTTSGLAAQGTSQLSYEETELQKALDFFIHDEVFMEKYLN